MGERETGGALKKEDGIALQCKELERTSEVGMDRRTSTAGFRGRGKQG